MVKMKKLLLFGIVFILLSSFASALSTETVTLETLDTTTTYDKIVGEIFNSTVTNTVSITATKGSLDTSTQCVLYNWDTKTLMNTSSFVGDDCEVSGSLTSGVEYLIGTNTGSRTIHYATTTNYPFLSTPNGEFEVTKRGYKDPSNNWITTTTIVHFSKIVFEYKKLEFQLTASNLLNGSALDSFNATFTNETTSTNIVTTNGSIYWNVNDLVNITIGSNDYFNRTIPNYNTSTNLNVEMWQSVLVVNAREKYTNTTILSFNVTATDGTNKQFTTSNASGNVTLLVNADTYNITGSAAMYEFNATNTTGITLGVRDTVITRLEFVSRELNVTAVNNITGTSLNDFTVQIRNDTLGILYNVSTSTGMAQLYAVDGGYEVTLFADGYAARKDVVQLENASQAYKFQLFASESVYIHIYDMDGGDLITQNVSLQFIYGTTVFTNYTASGGFFIANLTPGAYTIWAETENYTRTAYSTTVTEGSNQTLDMYLLPTSFTDEVTFEFQDRQLGNKLEDVSLAVTRVVGDSVELINTYSSDITGQIKFSYDDEVQYCFVAVLEGYTSKSWCLTPILSSQYTVIMEQTTTDVFTGDYTDVQVRYDPGLFYEGTQGYNFTILSPTGKLEGYAFAFYYESTLLANNSGDSTTGEVFSGSFIVPNASLGDTIKLTYSYDPTYGAEKEYTFYIPILVNTTKDNNLYGLGNNTYGLSLFERAFIVFLVAMVIGTIVNAIAGGVGASFVCAIIVALFIKIGFIDIWTGGVSLVIMVLIWLLGAGR
jgi:hypothetical protein